VNITAPRLNAKQLFGAIYTKVVLAHNTNVIAGLLTMIRDIPQTLWRKPTKQNAHQTNIKNTKVG
jgi:hypothetical protein